MKRLSKFALGIAAFLMMAGGLLALSGWIMGGETTLTFSRGGRTLYLSPFGIRGISSMEYAVEYAVVEDKGVKSVDGSALGAVASINIDVGLADIVLEPGEDYGIWLEWENAASALYYQMSDGALEVWNEIERSYNGPNEATVTVTYPAGANFEHVYLRTGLGSLTAEDLETGTLTVTADLGTVTLRKVKAAEADLDLSLGDLNGTDLEIAGITDVDSDLGDVNLSGTFHDMDLDCSMGKLVVKTALPQSEYEWSLDADMGAVRLNGAVTGKDGSVNGGRGPSSIQASCDLGDLELWFG